jgi:hypothetical protein
MAANPRGLTEPRKQRHHRQKGSINKVTKEIKAGCLEAATRLGRDGKGAGGFIGYLEFLGKEYPPCFAHLLGKLIPYQVNASLIASGTVSINIVTAPENNFISPEEAAKNIASVPAIIEGKPNAAIADEKIFDAAFVEVNDDIVTDGNNVASEVNEKENGVADHDLIVNNREPEPDDGGVIIMGTRRRRPFGSE